MSHTSAQRVDVQLSPSPATWREMLDRRWRANARDARALRLREQLGLPTDRPIVMTGHQPIVFHPGVLAKYLAADALGVHAAWLVVDKDETDPGSIEFPTRDAQGELGRSVARFLPKPPPGMPASAVPAHRVEHHALKTPWPFVDDGLRDIEAAFAAHESATSLAAQGAGATFDLMRAMGAQGDVIFASSMASTDLFRDLLERMSRDPLRFVDIYNASVARHPEAGIPPLLSSISADEYELPLWIAPPGEARRRAFVHDLDDHPPEHFASRAIMLTLVMRLGACDLFIHGTGGWVYDRITEDVAREWLDEELSPMTLATATLTLPLLERDPPTDTDVAHAKWTAHHAAHDPSMLGDPDDAQTKQSILREIERLPRRSRDRAERFAQMHQLLRDLRERRSDDLERLRRDAALIEREQRSATIGTARDWAFPLYAPPALEALRDAIHARFRE